MNVRTAMLYREGWGTHATLYAGYRARIPLVGEKVLVTNVYLNEERCGVVIDNDPANFEYTVQWVDDNAALS